MTIEYKLPEPENLGFDRFDNSIEGYTAAQMHEAFEAGRKAEREACADACNGVDEPGWTGYECPNTFQDGVFACYKAIRARGNE
jgi:hypothetical protein